MPQANGARALGQAPARTHELGTRARWQVRSHSGKAGPTSAVDTQAPVEAAEAEAVAAAAAVGSLEDEGSAAIIASAAAGNMAEAERALKQMHVRGLHATVEAYNSLIGCDHPPTHRHCS